MTQSGFRNKYIGDRAFYAMVLAVVVPILIQDGITNFVSLLDNIMVGAIGTEEMSGVAIVNNLIFVNNICLFGGLSGAGIFTAQYYGQGDTEGIRHTFRYKLVLGVIVTGLAFAIFLLGGGPLVRSYLNGDSTVGNLDVTFAHAMVYLKLMLWGLPGFMITQLYSSTLRECGETVVPMKASVAGVFVNLVLNYILIFGKFGFPAMGVSGAALATVISRYVSTAIVVGWAHTHSDQHPFMKGLFRTIRVPGALAAQYFVKGFPLLINETLWSAGIAILAQCYSVRGLGVVAANNICATISNVFNVVNIAMGSAIAIIIGQVLGSGDHERAKDTDRKLIAFSMALSTGVMVFMMISAPFFPMLYKTEAEIRSTATGMILVMAVLMPLEAFLNAAYFTIRSGGKTIITFFFDSFFMWVVTIPLAYVLCHFTQIPIVPVMFMVNAANMIKCIIGAILLKKGIWINTITTGTPCPCCGKIHSEGFPNHEICDECGWENDPVQREDPDFVGGANHMSLNEARAAYKEGRPVR